MLPNADAPQGTFNCKACLETTDEGTRAALHCGWMEEDKWAKGPAEIPKKFGSYEYDLDVCPGRIVRTDAVTEGTLAYGASQNGQLAVYFPEQENAVLEAATTVQAAFNEFDAERVKQQVKDRENKP